MRLSQIRLYNFKSYESGTFDFSAAANGLVGANGSGKTNLLDAVHYLCMTRSAFAATERENLRHGEVQMLISGLFEHEDERYDVRCGYEAGKRKALTVNRSEYERFSEHIGRFPCVLVAPDDTDLVREGSELRRRYFDSLICQFDAGYLESLIKYGRLVRERNSLLRQAAEIGRFDRALVEVFDEQILPLCEVICERRTAFVESFAPVFERQYADLTGEAERPSLDYKSDCAKPDFASRYSAALETDLQLRYTTKGVHRDDYDFRLDSRPLKKYGSQGQRKSYVIALKLAASDLLTAEKGFKPLLLLDDVFDKLDESRIGRLLGMIGEGRFGQLFVTDARPERSRALFAERATDFALFHLAEPHAQTS